ncbi:hypothetical protein BN341_7370 [Helicobacter heilmannii ASB1.4]|nr:hypothetical protein BN341_7370 [Helicobacter heilmannii ASB1.4]
MPSRMIFTLPCVSSSWLVFWFLNTRRVCSTLTCTPLGILMIFLPILDMHSPYQMLQSTSPPTFCL